MRCYSIYKAIKDIVRRLLKQCRSKKVPDCVALSPQEITRNTGVEHSVHGDGSEG